MSFICLIILEPAEAPSNISAVCRTSDMLVVEFTVSRSSGPPQTITLTVNKEKVIQLDDLLPNTRTNVTIRALPHSSTVDLKLCASRKLINVTTACSNTLQFKTEGDDLNFSVFQRLWNFNFIVFEHFFEGHVIKNIQLYSTFLHTFCFRFLDRFSVC